MLTKPNAKPRPKLLLPAMLAAAAAKADQTTMQHVTSSISSNSTVTIAPPMGVPKATCIVTVRTTPGGDVVSATIAQSTGHSAYDGSCTAAVWQASSFPLPSSTLSGLKF